VVQKWEKNTQKLQGFLETNFLDFNPLCKPKLFLLGYVKMLVKSWFDSHFCYFHTECHAILLNFHKIFPFDEKKIVQLIIFKILIRVQATKGGVFGPKTKVQIFKIPTKFLLLYITIVLYTFRLKSLYSRIRPVRKILEPIF